MLKGVRRETFVSLRTEKTMENALEIGIWSSARNTLEDYRILKACGVTHAFIDENYCQRGSQEYLKILEYCRQVGLKAYLFNYNSGNKFYADTTDYTKCEAFAGIVIYDEPSVKKFDEIAALIPEFEKRYPNGVFYINLFPNYGLNFGAGEVNSEWFGVESYEDYIEQYCQKVLDKLHGKKILSVDFYPLVTIPEENRVFLEKGWLRNLEIVAKSAKKHNALPYWYIQSTSFGLWRRAPKEKDFSYQYFVCLAYGAKGINHFTYTSPMVGGEFAQKDIALIDREYNPTENYYHVQALNERMQPLCKELFAYDYVGTMALAGSTPQDWREKENMEDLREDLKTLAELEIVDAQRSLLVAEFEKDDECNPGQKKRAYLLVNFTDPYRNENNVVTFKFAGTTQFDCLYKGERTTTTAESVSAEIESGEGMLLFL